MNVQVLLSCMNQNDFSIIERANIRTDAVIVNQCDRNSVDEFFKNSRKVKFISLKSRGVGISRNTALINSDQEILLFADDDVRYCDDYEKIIVDEFEKHPEADMICFNFKYKNEERKTRENKKFKKLSWVNCLRYGTYSMAIKREKVLKNRICFSLLFGGGARYGSGEDSLFISDCIKSGMKVFASPEYLGTVEQETSTWFSGYNEKYFGDKGAFWAAYSRHLFAFFCVAYLAKNRFEFKNAKMPFSKALMLMVEGGRNYNLKK